jgi:hypothetical protein
VHTGRERIITLSVEPGSTSAQPAGPEMLLAQIDEQPESSFDLILATGVLSRGASDRDERALLYACRRVSMVRCWQRSHFGTTEERR